MAQAATPPAGLPPETRVQMQAHAIAMHDRIDTDHDGFVTYDEGLRAAMAWVVPKGASIDPGAMDTVVARERFAAADLDHDGRISRAEAIIGADAAFDAQDTDHDGVLSSQKRSVALGRMIGQVERDVAAMAAKRATRP